MSRSYKKTPCYGIAKAESEKYDKRLANRKFRRRIRLLIKRKSGPKVYPTHLREVSNICTFAKDGKDFAFNRPDDDTLHMLDRETRTWREITACDRTLREILQAEQAKSQTQVVHFFEHGQRRIKRK